MPHKHALILFQTITPLHVGCGQDVGVVDLPVIRERTTGYPYVPGSGIRGAIRARFEEADPDLTQELFGPAASPAADKEMEDRYAGCVSIHDAKILLFPVRSDRNVFLWITCPHALHRYNREIEVFGTAGPKWTGSVAPGQEQVAGPINSGEAVFLEEFRYASIGDGGVGLADWIKALGAALDRADLADRAVLVSDESFAYFVRHATLIQQHNRLSSAKTVEDGALFAVEAVPSEAIFYGFLGGTESRRPPAEGKERKPVEQVLQDLKEKSPKYLQLGGDEGTGLGITRLSWVEA
jgi:CRISPR-associated protein Cmr4